MFLYIMPDLPSDMFIRSFMKDFLAFYRCVVFYFLRFYDTSNSFYFFYLKAFHISIL